MGVSALSPRRPYRHPPCRLRRGVACCCSPAQSPARRHPWRQIPASCVFSARSCRGSMTSAGPPAAPLGATGLTGFLLPQSIPARVTRPWRSLTGGPQHERQRPCDAMRLVLSLNSDHVRGGRETDEPVLRPRMLGSAGALHLYSPLPLAREDDDGVHVRPLVLRACASALAAGRCASASENGAPGRIRTCDLKIRSLLLYPAELRARVTPATEEDTSRGAVSDTLPRHTAARCMEEVRSGAGDGLRTRDPQLGRLML
jgi:hypothetical protein